MVLGALLTFIFFFVLQKDRLGGAPANLGQGSSEVPSAESQFDEKMEEKFMEELDIFYGEIWK